MVIEFPSFEGIANLNRLMIKDWCDYFIIIGKLIIIIIELKIIIGHVIYIYMYLYVIKTLNKDVLTRESENRYTDNRIKIWRKKNS